MKERMEEELETDGKKKVKQRATENKYWIKNGKIRKRKEEIARNMRMGLDHSDLVRCILKGRREIKKEEGGRRFAQQSRETDWKEERHRDEKKDLEVLNLISNKQKGNLLN